MSRRSLSKLLALMFSVILVLCMIPSNQPVFAEEEDEWEDFPPGFRITESSKPGKPVIILEEGKDHKSVKITICSNEYTSGYEIMMKEPGAKSYKKVKKLKKDGKGIRTYTVKKLKEGTYSFKVRAYLKYGGKTIKSEYSSVQKISLKVPEIVGVSEVKTGDFVRFGTWEQDDKKNGQEPLEWIVLSNEDSKLLLLSGHVINADNMNDSYSKKITWKDSSLRKWLNETFINTAFDSEQAGFIVSTELKDTKTTDKVFLLSKEEVTKEEYGFSSNYARIGTVSGGDFAVWTCNYSYSYPEHKNACLWWLRTSNKGKFSAVNCGGEVCDGVRCYFDCKEDDFEYPTGHYSDDDYEEVTLWESNLGIRPALVVDLAALKAAEKDSLITVTGEKFQPFVGIIEEPVERETVIFGYYEQDNNLDNGAEPIEWYVLSKSGSEMTLLSKYVLDCKPFATSEEQHTYEKVYWEMSSLRRWLNDDFYNTAFNKDEQSRIETTKLKNSDDRYYNCDNGNDTEDKVFIPTILDMLNPEYGFYYDDYVADLNRASAPTAYAIAQGAYVNEEPAKDEFTTSGEPACGLYWLRSKGYDSAGGWALDIYFSTVCFSSVGFEGMPLWYDITGVRPMIVVKLKK